MKCGIRLTWTGSYVVFFALLISMSINAFGEIRTVYISQSNIDDVKTKIAHGLEPWSSAFASLRIKADSYLDLETLSVTYQGRSGNDYYTMRPYDWSNNMPGPCGSTNCDGHINPKADRGDYEAAIEVSAAVRTLGLAYALTGEVAYADKARILIRVWTVDTDTRMTPAVARQQAIEQFITFPGLFYGAGLIWDYVGWTESERDAFSEWVESFATDVSTRSYENNWEDWRQVLVASAGALLNDEVLLDHAFSSFKNILSEHISASGAMSKELGRTKSLDYSMYALNALTQVAEIARHQGVDLYSFEAAGRSLELAWDYHVPYVLSPDDWPYEQISRYNGDNAAIYELAYKHVQKSDYFRVIEKFGRPMDDIRTLGPTTLTHSQVGSAQLKPAPPTNSVAH